MEWLEKEIKSKRFKRALNLFARLLIEKKGNWLTEDEIELVGRTFRNDQAKPAATWKRLLKFEEVKKEVNEKIVEILAEKGVNEGYLTEKRINAIDLAEKLDKPEVMLKGIEGFEDMLEMKPKTVKQVNTYTQTNKITASKGIDSALEATETKQISQETEQNEDDKKAD